MSFFQYWQLHIKFFSWICILFLFPTQGLTLLSPKSFGFNGFRARSLTKCLYVSLSVIAASPHLPSAVETAVMKTLSPGELSAVYFEFIVTKPPVQSLSCLPASLSSLLVPACTCSKVEVYGAEAGFVYCFVLELGLCFFQSHSSWHSLLSKKFRMDSFLDFILKRKIQKILEQVFHEDEVQKKKKAAKCLACLQNQLKHSHFAECRLPHLTKEGLW